MLGPALTDPNRKGSLMQHLHTSQRPLLAALATAAVLTACGRQQDDELGAAPRQGDDVAIADAAQSANQAEHAMARVSTDMGITAKVSAVLGADGRLKATQINVHTREGAVTLSGEAPDVRSRERATTLTAAVSGVTQVNNQLVVTRNG